jgi:hypothetical protein
MDKVILTRKTEDNKTIHIVLDDKCKVDPALAQYGHDLSAGRIYPNIESMEDE